MCPLWQHDVMLIHSLKYDRKNLTNQNAWNKEELNCLNVKRVSCGTVGNPILKHYQVACGLWVYLISIIIFIGFCTCHFQTPYGQIHLRDARIEDVDNTNDSDDETDVSMTTKQTVAIWPQYQGPTYLMVPTKHEKVIKLCSKFYMQSILTNTL